MSESKRVPLSVEFSDAEYHNVRFQKYDVQWIGETAFIVGSGERSESLSDCSPGHADGSVRNSALMSLVNLWAAISKDCSITPTNYAALVNDEKCKKHIVKWCERYGMPYIGDGENSVPVNELVDPGRNGKAMEFEFDDDLSEKIRLILYDGCDAIAFLQDCHIVHDRFMAWYKSEVDVKSNSELLSRFQFAGTAMYSVKLTSGRPILKMVFRSVVELAKMQLLCAAVLNVRKGNNFVNTCDMCGKLFMGRRNQKVCYNPCHRRDKGNKKTAPSEEVGRPIKNITVKRTKKGRVDQE